MTSQMTFDQLLAKAAEEANEEELVSMSAIQARKLIDELPEGNDTADDLANALDHAQGMVYSEGKQVAYVLIKIT